MYSYNIANIRVNITKYNCSRTEITQVKLGGVNHKIRNDSQGGTRDKVLAVSIRAPYLSLIQSTL